MNLFLLIIQSYNHNPHHSDSDKYLLTTQVKPKRYMEFGSNGQRLKNRRIKTLLSPVIALDDVLNEGGLLVSLLVIKV